MVLIRKNGPFLRTFNDLRRYSTLYLFASRFRDPAKTSIQRSLGVSERIYKSGIYQSRPHAQALALSVPIGAVSDCADHEWVLQIGTVPSAEYFSRVDAFLVRSSGHFYCWLARRGFHNLRSILQVCAIPARCSTSCASSSQKRGGKRMLFGSTRPDGYLALAHPEPVSSSYPDPFVSRAVDQLGGRQAAVIGTSLLRRSDSSGEAGRRLGISPKAVARSERASIRTLQTLLRARGIMALEIRMSSSLGFERSCGAQRRRQQERSRSPFVFEPGQVLRIVPLLTPREISVLRELVKGSGGASNKEIGARLGLSEDTIKNLFQLDARQRRA